MTYFPAGAYHYDRNFCRKCWQIAKYKNPDGTTTCLCNIQKGATVNGIKTCDVCFENPLTRGLLVGGLVNVCHNIEHRYYPDEFLTHIKAVIEQRVVYEPPQVDCDVDLVMSQTNCTRQVAIDVLKKYRGDIVNAIMELTV